MKWREIVKGLLLFLGTAGTGKTYTAVRYYVDRGYKVKVLTATNNTARALAKSLGIDVQTICSGAFINRPPVEYYVEFKDLSDYDVIIIDEALLAGTKRVFDLARELMKDHLVIICTDDRQMLPDLNNEGILGEFNKIKEIADDIVYFTDIHRTDDETTKQMYNFWYDRAGKDDKIYFADDLKEMFDYIPYTELEYDSNTVYICVSNNDEQFIVDYFGLAGRDDVETIPKGASASQVNCNRRMPKLTQLEALALGAKEWYGYAPVFSIVRGQGITADGDVVLVIGANSETSGISDKGVYTAFTRCRHFKNFHVTVVPTYNKRKLDTFNGKPVKDITIYQMKKTKAEIKAMGDDMIPYVLRNVNGVFKGDTDTTFFDKKHLLTKDKKHISIVDKDTVVFDNKKYTVANGNTLYQTLNPHRNKWSRTYANGQLNLNPYNLAKKMTPINYMDEVYEICNEHNVDVLNFFDISLPRHKGRRFEFDLRKAYPHAFYLAPLPTPGIIKREYDPEMLNFYFVNKKGKKRKCITTERHVSLLRQYDFLEIEYAFSTPFKIGCAIGNIFKEMLQTKEGTDDIYSAVRIVKEKQLVPDDDGLYVEKEVEREEHYYEWGWFLKKYIERNNSCYVRNIEHCWELLLIAIKAEMSYQTLKASMAIKGADPNEGLNVDAFYFDEFNDDVINKINTVLDEGWEYRINSTEPIDGAEQYKDGRFIAYQNFKNPETKEERDARLAKARRKAYKERKKAEKMLDNDK